MAFKTFSNDRKIKHPEVKTEKQKQNHATERLLPRIQ